MRFLANENFPGTAVTALVAVGHDVVWVRNAAPGMSDPEERRGDLGHAATSRFLSPLSEPDMRFRIQKWWPIIKAAGIKGE